MSGKPGGLGGLFGKESAASAEVYLNLTPLMDVMSNILFFLMSAFGASIIAIMPTSVPAQSFGETSIEVEEDKVTVSVRVDGTGLSVQADSQTLTPDVLKPFGAKIAKKGADYDLATFRAHLLKIKQKWPGSSTMILVPDDELRYETIVKIMDSARDTKLPDGRVATLFPEVVFSSIYKGEEK